MVVGVGMIMGDGVLTPAVSVVSAVEGLAVASPSSFVPGDGADRALGLRLAVAPCLFKCLKENALMLDAAMWTMKRSSSQV